MKVKLQLKISKEEIKVKNNIYINQIFTEGLATTFYQKPKIFLKSKIKNTLLLKVLNFLILISYIIILLLVICIIFTFTFPL